MNISAPHTAVAPKVDGKVLMLLAGTTRPISSRDMARLAGASQNATNLALRRLVSHGLVHVQEAGRGAALLYTLNRDHVAAEAVLILASLRSSFIARLTEAVREWPLQPVHASIFRSAARGDGDVESDIDLFVVRPNGIGEDDERWRAQIDQLARQVESWTGNHAGIAEASQADIGRLKRERPGIVREFESDAVILAGTCEFGLSIE